MATRTVTDQMTDHPADKPKRFAPDLPMFRDLLGASFRRTMMDVQKGLASRSYDTGRFSVRREIAGYHFHRLLARQLRDFAA